MIRQEERLEALERAVSDLVELNRTVPVIVEGKRDVAALRHLGLSGRILVVNSGRPLIDVCDDLAERYPEIVLLVDWDRTGGQLMKRIGEILKGRLRVHREFRRQMATFAEVADVESMDTYMASLRRKVAQVTRTGHEPGTPQSLPLSSDPMGHGHGADKEHEGAGKGDG